MSSNNNNNSSSEVFAGGATTSQHVDAQDDDHFENTTFKLKRTRSLGLLDEFIQPEEKQEKLQQQGVKSSNDKPPQHEKLTVDTSMDSNSNDDQSISPSPTYQSISPEMFESPEILPHDDTDIYDEPSRHVDYLSHQWDVSDISKSWRYVISKRKDVANSARLENASWRTWAQRRGNLKTINPEDLNWSKDNDVTWLYGPILMDEDAARDDDGDAKHTVESVTTCTSAAAGDISISNKNSTNRGPKPILKRRTVEDVIISHSNLLKLQLATNNLYQKQRQKQQRQLKQQQLQKQEEEKRLQESGTPEFDDYGAISAKLNSQYKNIPHGAQSSSQSNSLVNLQNLVKKNSSSNLAHKPTTLSAYSTGHTPSEANQSQNDENSDGVTFKTRPSSDDTETAGGNVKQSSQEQLEKLSLTEQDPASIEETKTNLKKKKSDRHIHFNDEVKQCIALNYSDYNDDYDDDSDEDDYDYMGRQGYYYDGSVYSGDDDGYMFRDYSREEEADQVLEGDNYEGDEDDDDEDDDDEGGFFLNVKSPTTHPTVSNIPFNSKKHASLEETGNTEDADSVSSNDSVKTIQLLPSTTLNYGSSDEDSTEENPYTSSLSHNVDNHSRRGYDYYYDYNTVYTVDPNHAIYGNKKDVPEVCDVPENISMGSNFDYEEIENEELGGPHYPTESMPIINSSVIHYNNVNQSKTNEDDKMQAISSPFHLSDSEDSDESSDDGALSIGTRRSSHSLAQSVFGKGGLSSSSDPSSETHYPASLNHPQPVASSVSTINPRHSSTSLSKQSSSSNALSSQFFGGAPALTKQSTSSNSLSQQFFGGTTGLSKQKASSTSLSDHFASSGLKSGIAPAKSESGDRSNTLSPESTQRTLNTQKKATPLPPHTTSTNAFSGNTTPPLNDISSSTSGSPAATANKSYNPSANKTFVFDSDSDSEPSALKTSGTFSSGSSEHNYTPSYASLSQVAGKNGIGSVSTEGSPSSGIGQTNQEHSSNKIVDQAKGLANHFLGGWKQNTNVNTSAEHTNNNNDL